jgi:4-hydroxybutyryl-CoA dehydratase / vinylacetyl-CoA-Delta-isomerase
MTLRTPQQYVDSIRQIKQKVFIAGQRINDVTDHPNTRPVIAAVSKTYELALDPGYENILTTKSHLTGEKISRWCHVPHSIDDLDKRRQMNTLMSSTIGTCHARCTGQAAAHFLAAMTYSLDKALGTGYYQRFNNFLKLMQHDDLTCSEAQTDAKGDRGKRPSAQQDADVYLRVVEKKSDGIVVRGAKMWQEGNFSSHYHLVLPPLRTLAKGEEQHALSFVVPTGTEGLTYICQDSAPEAERRDARDIGALPNPIYGSSISSMTVFDNVFVPWENVFMCGEVEFTGTYLERVDKLFNMICRGACKTGFMDLMIGAAATMAEYNGVAKSSHIVDKITEMIRIRETTYACSMASVLLGSEDPPGSGIFFPDLMCGLATSLNTQYGFPEIAVLAGDLAGGAVVTMPSELELQNPETSEYVRKYLKAVSGVPVEDRMRMMKFLQHWAAGSQVMRMWHGGGPSQGHRVTMYVAALPGLEKKKASAKKLAGIKE